MIGPKEITTMKLSPRFEQALMYATLVHAHQERKGSGIPYIAHLLGVCSLVLENGGNEDAAIGALLHDAPEDVGGQGRLDNIRLRFGKAVTDIVKGCSGTFERPKPDWERRKRSYIKHVRSARAAVRLVSAAGKLHNARATLEDVRAKGDAAFSIFKAPKDRTLWYYRELVKAYRLAGSNPLVEELDRVVSQIEQLATK